MTYLPVPIPHGRPERCERRRGAVAVALLIAAAIVLVTGGIAMAAATSPRLSASGWRTYKGFERVTAGTGAVDVNRPKRAHIQLRRLISRCSHLRGGRGIQSSGIRATCKSELRTFDHVLAMQRCADVAGGSDDATGICFIAALPTIDADLDANAHATAAVAGTLLAGRCQTAFAAQALRSGAAAQNGRSFLAALQSSDPQAMQTAIDAWSTAIQNALDIKLGTNGQGCGPPIAS